MKRLTDLIEVNTEDLPSVYCDMDMVLCNFMKKADEVSGGDFVTADKDQRWKDIISEEDLQKRIQFLATIINKDDFNHRRSVVFVGILNGAFMFSFNIYF